MTSLSRLRTAKRFSSSRFSDAILAERTLLIFSWSDQRSSLDMASRFIFFIDVPLSCILSFRRLIILSGKLLRKWSGCAFLLQSAQRAKAAVFPWRHRRGAPPAPSPPRFFSGPPSSQQSPRFYQITQTPHPRPHNDT